MSVYGVTFTWSKFFTFVLASSQLHNTVECDIPVAVEQ